jgi:hypothetical protein
MKKIVVLFFVSAALIIKEKTVVTPPEKSTSVTLDKNGVKVETKKVNVTIKQ